VATLGYTTSGEVILTASPPEIGSKASWPLMDANLPAPRFTRISTDAGGRVSMDGRGRWMDKVFIERLWRSLKYECVFLHGFESGSEARTGIGRWTTYYNASRPHSALGGRTPIEAHRGPAGTRMAV